MPDRKSWSIKVTRKATEDQPEFTAHCAVSGCSARRVGPDAQKVFDFMKGHMASAHLGARGQKGRDSRTVYVGDEFKFVKKY